MLKIQSNLKINGRHWGLAFVDGTAYTTNAFLAAKLRKKGYVVTDVQPEQTEVESKPETAAEPVITPAEAEAVNPAETTKHKSSKPLKKAVSTDVADAV